MVLWWVYSIYMSENKNVDNIFKKLAKEFRPKMVYTALVIGLLGMVLSACGNTVEVGGVTLETTSNGQIVHIETGPDVSKFDGSSYELVKQRQIEFPENLRMLAADPDDVERLCDREDDMPGIIHDCLIFDDEKYVGVVENKGDEEQKLLSLHEALHSVLREQYKTDETMNYLTGPDYELLVRYHVLNDAVFRYKFEYGLNDTDKHDVAARIKQLTIAGDIGASLEGVDKYLYLAWKLAGGTSNFPYSVPVADAMVNGVLQEMDDAKVGMARSYFGNSLYNAWEYQGLVASLADYCGIDLTTLTGMYSSQ